MLDRYSCDACLLCGSFRSGVIVVNIINLLNFFKGDRISKITNALRYSIAKNEAVKTLKIFFAYLSILQATATFAAAMELKSIIVDFARNQQDGAAQDSTAGTIYYCKGQKTIIRVYRPVEQWVVLDSNTMQIYYPNKNQLIRLISQAPAMMPFFQVTLHAINGKMGYEELGFTLKRTEMKDDTLCTYWDPPEKLDKIIGTTSLFYCDKMVVFIAMSDKKNGNQSKIYFNDYKKIGRLKFPMELRSISFRKRKIIIESIRYDSLRVNLPIPVEVADFKIPPDCQIKEVKW